MNHLERHPLLLLHLHLLHHLLHLLHLLHPPFLRSPSSATTVAADDEAEALVAVKHGLDERNWVCARFCGGNLGLELALLPHHTAKRLCILRTHPPPDLGQQARHTLVQNIRRLPFPLVLHSSFPMFHLQLLNLPPQPIPHRLQLVYIRHPPHPVSPPFDHKSSIVPRTPVPIVPNDYPSSQSRSRRPISRPYLHRHHDANQIPILQAIHDPATNPTKPTSISQRFPTHYPTPPPPPLPQLITIIASS